MPQSKQPSFMRYARVQGVLEQEAAFVAKMGGRTEAVFKPSGESQLFSPGVISVTQAIHSAGKDAHKVHKTEIVRIACQVFRIGRSDPPPPETNGTAVSLPETNGTAVSLVIPAVPKPVKATKKQPPKPKEKQTAPPKPAEPKNEEPPAPSPSENEVREEALAKAKELINPERAGESQSAFNAYISIYSMILTALQLTEIYDNQPGREKRYKTLDELAKEVNKFTAIKSAKEAKKA